MVDDRSEDATLAGSGRPKREPPTIDLKATAVSDAVKPEADEAREAEQVAAEPASRAEPPPSQAAAQPVSPWAIAPISGAVAAALVIGVGWVLGWPAVQAPAPAPKVNAAAIDDLVRSASGVGKSTRRVCVLLAIAEVVRVGFAALSPPCESTTPPSGQRPWHTCRRSGPHP